MFAIGISLLQERGAPHYSVFPYKYVSRPGGNRYLGLFNFCLVQIGDPSQFLSLNIIPSE